MDGIQYLAAADTLTDVHMRMSGGQTRKVIFILATTCVYVVLHLKFMKRSI